MLVHAILADKDPLYPLLLVATCLHTISLVVFFVNNGCQASLIANHCCVKTLPVGWTTASTVYTMKCHILLSLHRPGNLLGYVVPGFSLSIPAFARCNFDQLGVSSCSLFST